MINEPAFQKLRSQHDLSCQMKRRFSKKQCVSLLIEHGFEIEKATYRVCFLFPLIAAVKIIKKWVVKQYPASDLNIPPSPINGLLTKVQRWENVLIQKGYKMPCGSSVFLIGCLKQEATL